jgi:hypothetical protein
LEPEPPTLDYQRPARQPGATRGRGRWFLSAFAKYVLGVVCGLALSTAYYAVLIKAGGSDHPEVLLGAVGFKVVAGLFLVFVERWRAFGLGLITSVPIAVLIFFGLCFVAMSQ